MPKVDQGGKRLIVKTRSASTIDAYTGNDDVSTWDDDELRAGRRRSSAGHLTGRRPAVIPQACHQELARRMLSRIDRTLHDAMEEMVEELVSIAQGRKLAKKDQLKAIEMVMERVLGKPDVNVNVSAEQTPWQRALHVSVVGTEEDVVDAEVVDEDDAEVEWGDE